mmetsp:Transcript_9505/g.14266  ORF Transcript_9505/g.14266 Transcript_9505/m.14266 type:complete len:228 (-) Transcript_9505:142-825(-)
MGLREAVDKSLKMVQNASYLRERKLLENLFTEISRDTGRFTLGPHDTWEAVSSGASKILILDADSKYETLVCEKIKKKNGKKDAKSLKNERKRGALEEEMNSKKPNRKDSEQDFKGETVYIHTASVKEKALRLQKIEDEGSLCVHEVIPFIEWAIEFAKSLHGVEVKVVNRGFDLAKQFREGFGGIASITRYQFRTTASYENTFEADDDSSSSSSDSEDEDIDAFFD